MHNSHSPTLGTTISMFLEKKAVAAGVLKFSRKKVIYKAPRVSAKSHACMADINISVDASATK